MAPHQGLQLRGAFEEQLAGAGEELGGVGGAAALDVGGPQGAAEAEHGLEATCPGGQVARVTGGEGGLVQATGGLAGGDAALEEDAAELGGGDAAGEVVDEPAAPRGGEHLTRGSAAAERAERLARAPSPLMAGLAAGAVPQGYDLAMAADPLAAPRCAAPAPFRVDFASGQHLTGGQLEAWVGTVRHTGGSPAELAETACATTPEVVAVAIWPSPRLQPGELAEIYVVRRVTAAAARQPRPSLIEVGHGF